MKKKLFSFLLTLCIVFCLAPITALAEGETGVAINDTNFPDANFLSIVKGFDTDGNGYLSDAEIAAVAAIKCDNKSICNLTGIEYFTALMHLWCQNNQITSLDLSKNTALNTLWCYNNQLTSLDVSKNTDLDFLSCSNNRLTSLDISKNTAIVQFAGINNTYQIAVDENRKFNLSSLPGSFDVTKASNWSGGTVSGSTLTVDNDKDTVTYTYDCGNETTVKFTLKCNKANYTVSFNTNGGSSVATQTIEHGGKAAKPKDSTKNGYIFTGWYTDKACTKNYNFDTPVTAGITLYAGWSECDHSGSTTKPTCGTPAICTICKGTIAATGNHTYEWRSENDKYWKKCKFCGKETPKKVIPKLILNAPDTVCRTQDCTFTFSLPEGCTNPEFGYEFTMIGSGNNATVKNGVCSGTIEADWYDQTETSFKLTVYAITSDGFSTSTSKTIEIVNEHTYDWQSENGEYWQKCKVCGKETAKKIIPEIALSGADKVCRSQGYTFDFTLPKGCKLITVDYVFEKLGSNLPANFENGKYTVKLTSSGYPAEENGFKVTVNAETADGFAIKAENNVTILNEHTGGKATCIVKAKCTICGAEYGEPDPKNHSDLKHFPTEAATKISEGNIEYWYCDGCNKYYSDKDGTKEISKAATIIAKEISKPATITTKPNNNSISPLTGDTSTPALWIALLLISGSATLGITIVSKMETKK